MARHINGLRWQSQRLQAGTQRRWVEVEYELGESHEQVESRQPDGVPSPKLFSFRVYMARFFML